ncbi:MAG TPA: hypothetical protein VM261_24415 [Kofleriaceae bacterium]|nr:hypothetical protein [Kofleriaceae bacterium]
MRPCAVLIVVMAVACGGKGGTPSIGGDPRSPDADVAVVGTPRGLVEIGLATGKARALVPGANVSWCAVDDRARVVWFTTPEGEGDTFALHWYDVVAGGASHTAFRGAPTGISEIIIDHGDAGRIGGSDRVSFFVGVRVDLGAAPAVGAELGCDGDAWFYCYESSEDGNVDDAPLRPEHDELRRAVDALALVERDALAALVERSRGRALWPPAPPQPEESEAQQRVAGVPDSRCPEEPDACGRATPLAGTPYWLVVIDNARGDFFHETRSLYDPATKRFFRADDPSVRSPALIDGAAVEGLYVSPSGAGGAIGGRVVDFRRGVVWQSDDASACGWLGGGYRVGGPRG